MNEELQGIVQRMVEAGEPEENIKLVIENYSANGGGEQPVGKPLGSEEPTQESEVISQSPVSSTSNSQLEERANEAVRTNQPPEGTTITPEGQYTPTKLVAEEVLQERYSPFVPNIQQQQKEVVLGKNYTPTSEIERLKEERIDNQREFDRLVSEGSEQRDVLLRVGELDKKLQDLNRVIPQAEKNNADILSAESGAVYKINQKELPLSEFYKQLTSAELTDKLRYSPKEVKIEVTNDPNMQAFVMNQLEGAEKSKTREAIEDFATTFKSITDAIDVKGAELQTGLFGVDTDFNINNLPVDARSPFLAAKKAEEEGGDPEDAFLQEYYKQKEKSREQIKGIRMVVEEDAIDRIANEDVTGAAQEIAKMAVGSAPYTLVAAATPVGIGLIANAAQTDSYYKARQDGLSKGEALVTSGLTAAVETADAAIERLLFVKGLNQAAKTARSTAKGAGYSSEQITQFAKDAVNAYVKEMPTEFAQGSLTSIIEDVSRGREVTMDNFRQGALEALAAAPQSTIVASPNLARMAYARTKKVKDIRRMEDAAIQMMFEGSSPNLNKTDRRALMDAAVEMSNEAAQEKADIDAIKDKATKEQTSELVEITKKEASLESALASTSISDNTKKQLQERVTVLDERKQVILDEIQEENEKEEDIKEQQPVLEGVQTSGDKKESGKESAELRSEEQAPQKEIEVGDQIEYGEGLQAEVVEDLGDEVMVKSPEGNEFTIPKEDATKQTRETTAQPTEESEAVQQEQEVVEQDEEPTIAIDEGDRGTEATATVINDSRRDIVAVSDSFKQGFEEYKTALKEKEATKRKKLTDKANKKLQEVRERAKDTIDRLRSDKEAKTFTTKIINDVLQQAGLKSVPRKAVKDLQRKVAKADRRNLRQIIDEVMQVVDKAKFDDRTNKLKSPIKKAITKAKKGGLGRFQENYEGLNRIETEFIPFNRKGENLLGKLEELTDRLNQPNVELDREGIPLSDDVSRVLQEYDKLLEETTKTFDKVRDFVAENARLNTKGEIVDLNFSEAINEMVEQGELTQEEADMVRNSREFKQLPKAVTPKPNKNETPAQQIERAFLSDYIAKGFTPKEVNDLIDKYGLTLKPILETLNGFSEQDLASVPLKDLRTIANNMSNALKGGDFEGKLGGALRNVESGKRANTIKPTVQSRASRISVFDIINRVFNKGRGRLQKMRQSPTRNIDFEAFGDFKGRNVFNGLFKGLQVAENNLDTEKRRLTDALGRYSNKFKDPLMDIKASMFAYDLEYATNPNSDDVAPLIDFIQATWDELRGEQSEGSMREYKKNLKKVLDEYATFNDDGEVVAIDIDRIGREIQADKAANEYLDTWYINVNPRLDQYQRTANAQKGIPYKSKKAYNPRVIMGRNTSLAALEQSLEDIKANDQASFSAATASKTGKERTKGAKPVIFSIQQAHKQAINETLLDYFMTPEVKTTLATLGKLETWAELSQDDYVLDNVRSVRKVAEESMSNQLIKNYASSLDEKGLANFVNYINKKGYQLGLGYPTRAVAEAISNMAFAAWQDKNAVKAGMRFANISDKQMVNVENFLGMTQATQASRLLGWELTSMELEAGALSAKSVLPKALKGLEKQIDDVQAFLLSRPDVTTARVIFFGKFANEYKKITGKDFDISKFSELEYQNNKEAFDEAIDAADQALFDAVSSNGSYTGSLASVVKPTDNAIAGLLSNYDKFLTRFMRTERSTAKKALYSLAQGKKKSKMNRLEAAKLLAGSATRYLMYDGTKAFMTAGIATLTLNLLFGQDKELDFGLFEAVSKLAGDDEEEKKKALHQLERLVLRYGLDMATGGMGNIAKQGINGVVEVANALGGEGVTRPEGDAYDAYKNSVTYSNFSSAIQQRDATKIDPSFMLGASAPFAKSLANVAKYTTKALDGSEAAQERLAYKELPMLIGAVTGLPTKEFTSIADIYLFADDNAGYSELYNIMNDTGLEMLEIGDLEIEDIE